MSITAVYSVIWWEPRYNLKDFEYFGAANFSTRYSEVYRLAFASQADKDAYPARLRFDVAARGGELVLCQEIQAKMDADA